MGYSEVLCKICGTSFNMGRIRRPSSPASHAWAYAEPGIAQNFVTKEYITQDRCKPDSGCRNVLRIDASGTDLCAWGKNGGGKDEWLVAEGDEEDGEYVYESDASGEEEGFEWESDSDVVCGDGRDSEEEGDGSEGDEEEDPEEGMTSIPIRDTAQSQQHSPPETEPQPEAYNSDSSGSSASKSNLNRYQKCLNYEHLAGPNCIHARGHNGCKITAAQMKGCDTIQCLVRKPPNWTPEPDDQDWELTSNYFLSGLSGHMPSRDICGSTHIPPRHRAEKLNPDNIFWDDPPNELATPMPFHPTCFEIYTRASILHSSNSSSHPDISGLAHWRLKESSYTHTRAFPYSDPAVRRGNQQEWRHHPGDEWLAANPICIPGLPELLASCIIPEGEEFSTRNSAFPAHPVFPTRSDSNSHLTNQSISASTITTPNPDPFLILPLELTLQILSYLPPSSIASLRLSSRAFTHLPNSFFRKLLRREMPWFYELYSRTPPSFWVTTSWQTLCSERDRRRAAATSLSEMRDLHKKVIGEDMPEIWEQWCTDHGLTEERVAEAERVVEVDYATKSELADWTGWVAMPAERTDWYKLYCEVVGRWDEFPGLRNRRRIWMDCEEILRRVGRYRWDREIE
ncbi:hypothetical protein K432DRAFT_38253 [Lepidopterella palustris CBS 459.81]|uniref:F-box domain-containing protein n=1 Tax=Lepidopterella palustris CBS 459.81 TaxID=1314670 RepID=A0A8E2EB01_9PEZI|nr:hypothetical protein K432DRAFT_38253 [Lepidopterella palustris CBS 459.81]